MRLKLLLAASFLLAPFAHAQTAPADPYLWLEEVSSTKAMDWVNSHNAASVARLEPDPRYKTLYDQALEIAGARDRIPAPRFLHGEIYNFWQDADHLRGYWR